MLIERIGCVSDGDVGTETYVRVQIEPKDKREFPNPDDWKDLVKGYMADAYYSRSLGPGSTYCTDIRVAAVPYANDRFIGMARHQYDV